MKEFLEGLIDFRPQESQTGIVPVTLEVGRETGKLPSAVELSKLTSEEIRVCLNKKASEILSEDILVSIPKYEDFLRIYDDPVYRAWYTTTNPGNNFLLGYELLEEVAKGAFGKVYKAKTITGEYVAVKVLLEEIRMKSNLLQAFRRGVRSMKILAYRGVSGMVAYREGSEIPAFVAMDWIDGPNLKEGRASGNIFNWRDILRIGKDLTSIIRSGHLLPERVLHRDIRPSNVMLKGFYSDPDNWEVVVLDFDLSWHIGASEESISHGSSLGYLAPEQIRPDPNASTRNSAVDSFGLGMTLLFLCSGRDPVADEHRHSDWASQINEFVSKVPGGSWKSIALRFSRLILNSTLDSQAARWDVSQIESELVGLYDAIENPSKIDSEEFFVEEIASRSEMMRNYKWDENKLSAKRKLASGTEITLLADQPNGMIHLNFDWSAVGLEEHRKVSKYVASKMESARGKLAANRWEVTDSFANPERIYLRAHVLGNEVVSVIKELVTGIDRAAMELQFS